MEENLGSTFSTAHSATLENSVNEMEASRPIFFHGRHVNMRDRFARDTSRQHGAAARAAAKDQFRARAAMMRPAAVAARARIMRASHVTDVGVTRDRYGSEGGRIHTSLGGSRGNISTKPRCLEPRIQNERYLL